jgi:predicted ATPase/DNA-binding winged helix-turn-helix (wHTH) protein
MQTVCARGHSVPHENIEDSAISFGPFRLDPAARLLEKHGAPIQIGGRALDILIFLARRAGEVVNKRELVERVWSDVTVDEGSLRFHVTALRKVLGDGTAGARYVVNVPGRGYCFTAPLTRAEQAPVVRHVIERIRAPSLPAPLTRMIGRSDTVDRVSTEIELNRLVTIVGPAGIGKTSVAVAVAHRQLASFSGRTFFVDFGSLKDARLVPGAIASVLGPTVNSEDPLPDLLTFLRGERVLLILDSCEHVLETLAPLAETLVHETLDLHVLATSRESLRAEGEQVHRLFPLDCPPQCAGLGASDVLAYSAAQLFVERIAAHLGGFVLSDAEAPLVAEICRRLDGIPLAIELAAGRVNAYGITGIASLLNSRFSLQWQGRRTAVPRHQTLSAALGWSYQLLPAAESTTLRRLSVFVGPFTLEAAVAVASGEGVSEPEVVEAIASLVSKSLIATPSAERSIHYRLLDTTRAFAAEKLAQSGEGDRIARAHARYSQGSLHDRVLRKPAC